tara:strand:+ start:188 stop:982 length:795 start_codon:yes stop_codon:yes gene_type:complete
MSEIRVNKVIDEAGTGAVELTQGATLPSGKTISGSGTIAVNSSGTAAGLSGTPDITVGTVTASTVSGTTGAFSGNVSVGGTLTYTDVTNIDSVGIITARKGIKVSTGGIAVSAGIVTAAAGVNVSAGGLDVAAGTVYLSGVSKEKANVTTTTINTATFDLNDGMVHFRNSSAPSAISSNALLTYSPSNVNTFMAVNDVLSVTIMNTGASNAYFGGLSIDGASQTVHWAGGSAPSDGSAKDMYVFTIVKTAASTYTVFGNQTKTA